MGFLLLAILSSASIALIFKWTEGKGSEHLNRFRMTAANYWIAAVVSLGMWLIQGRVGVENLNASSLLFLGVPAGVCYFASFVFYQLSVKKYGAALSGMFGKLGILLPMVLSIVIWAEYPSFKQTLGILIAGLAMFYVISERSQSPSEMGHGQSLKPMLIALFFAGGFAEFSGKIYQKVGNMAVMQLFLFVVFATAFCLSYTVFLTAADRNQSRWQNDWLTGALVGVPNLLSSYFLIRALNLLPAALVFPIYSAGAITVISVGSWLIFKEHLTQRSVVAILGTIMALVLVNS